MESSKNILVKTSIIADGNMSARFGEQKSVIENRTSFLKQSGIDFSNHIPMRCNHGNNIVAVDHTTLNADALKNNEMVDAEVLVTHEKNLALLLLTADCIPGVFYDSVQGIIALAHMNRKTIAHGIAQKTVRFLCEQYNSNPSNLEVYFGPHIKKESYVFPLPLTQETPYQLADFMETIDSAVHIDMTKAFIQQLAKTGVAENQIEVSTIDTGVSQNHFSHYRTSRDITHPAGRLATIVMITS